MAECFAKYCLNLVAHRLKRELWLWSWPNRFVMLLDDRVGERSDTLERLQHDYMCDQKAEAHLQSGDTRGLEALQARSVFKLAPVIQLVEICKLEGWQVSPRMLDWTDARFRKVLHSQVVEDSFNRMKHASKKHMTKTARHVTHWRNLVESPVLAQVHRYKAVPFGTTSLDGGRIKLPETTFCPEVSSLSVDPKGLATTKSTAPWYSPSADRLPVQHGDLALRRQCVEEGFEHAAPEKTFLAAFMKVDHNIIVRRRAGSPGFPEGGPPGPWLYPLMSLPGSSAIFWKVGVSRVGVLQVVDFSVEQGSEPVLMAVWCLNHWEGTCVRKTDRMPAPRRSSPDFPLELDLSPARPTSYTSSSVEHKSPACFEQQSLR